MDYRILGPLELQDGGRTVPLPQGRRRLLLAVLLTRANQTVSRDRLIDALWGESPPPTAGASLHNLVSAIRKDLGADALVTHGHGYMLCVAPGALDAERFEELSREGTAALARGDPEHAAARLRDALQLWRGPPLADLAYHPALAEEAARLEAARMLAVEERIDADLARGRHVDVIAELDALTAQHPLDERLRAQQILALYRAGRQADALAAYRDARERLVDELGIEPGPSLRRLHQAVLAQDAELGGTDPLPVVPPAVAWARRHAGVLIGAGALMIATAVIALLVTGGGDAAPERAAVRAGDYLAAIDPATRRVTSRLTVDDSPAAVTVGAGAAWTVNADGNTISRMDLRTHDVDTVSTGTIPLDIAAGDDSVWVVGARSNLRSAAPPETLTRLDPASGAPVAEIALPPARGLPSRGAPQLVAVGGGAVWAIGRTGRLQRVDLRSNTRKEITGFRALKVVAGDGQVWAIADPASKHARSPDLLRLDGETGGVRDRSPLPADAAGPIAVGAGAVWLADGFTGAVWRIDAAGRAPSRPIAVDQGIDSIAAGGDEVWTANSLAGTVARIDPTRNEVTHKLSLDAAPRGVAIGDGRVWVTGAGAGRSAAPAGSLRAGARVEPITARSCGPVLTGRDGDPDFLIVYDDVFEGGWRSTIESVNAAIAFVLREHGFRAGRFRVGLQACNDGSAQSGFPDETKCQANAKAYARNPRVVGVVGPSHSYCAEVMLPVLNRAAGGPVAVVSHANSGVGLVRRDPAAPAGRLAELYPTGRRGYARVHPSDDYEVAAAALFAQQKSPRGVFFVTDGFADGGPWPVYFRRAARRIDLPILDTATQEPQSRGVRRLAERIRASGARAVYLQTGETRYLRRLRPLLSPDIAVISSSMGGIPIARMFTEAGDAARGVYVTVPGRPLERLGPTGLRFLRDFGATRSGGRTATWAVYGAAATEALLDAIARSDGTRESIARALTTVDLPDSPLGPLRLERNGEPATNPIGVVRADHGGEPDDGVATAGGVVVDVITPPARLVGGRAR